MPMNPQQLKNIVEAALLAAGEPLSLDRLQTLFVDEDVPAKDELRAALEDLAGEYAGRGFELKEIGSGYRMQVKTDMAPWVSRLWEEKPQRYSRATLETLALIAYRQPISRAEIENVRGVSVSTHIIKSLTDREWIRVVGHREVPGRPALYGTTKAFLDYFNMRSLEELPTLAEVRNLDEVARSLDAAMLAQDVPPVDDEEHDEISQIAPAAENAPVDSAPLESTQLGSAPLETVALPMAEDESPVSDAASTEPPARPPRRPERSSANDDQPQGAHRLDDAAAENAADDAAAPQVANG